MEGHRIPGQRGLHRHVGKTTKCAALRAVRVTSQSAHSHAGTFCADGVFRLLDSQCKTPNATESTFCKELNRVHAKADFLVPTRKHRMRCVPAPNCLRRCLRAHPARAVRLFASLQR